MGEDQLRATSIAVVDCRKNGAHMVRMFALTLAIAVTASSPASVAAQSDVRTMTGWFADAQCAAPRVAKGIIAPNNPDCVKRCLEEGVPAVFISEQAKTMFEIRDYPSVKADVGYHIELTGTVDKAGKAISVQSVKRLSYAGAICRVPPRDSRKK